MKLELLATEFFQKNFVKIICLLCLLVFSKQIKSRIEILLKIFFEKINLEKSLTTFLVSLHSFAYYIAIIYLSIEILGIDTKKIITVFGTMGVLSALAFRDMMSNICGGFAIIMFRPFVVGDVVEFGSYTGEVKKIEIFYTKIKNSQNELVIIPNGIITGTELRNITKEKIRRLDLTIPVDSKKNADNIKKTFEKIINDNIHFKAKTEHEDESEKYILPKPSPVIGISEIRLDSIEFTINVYTKTRNYKKLKAKLNAEIVRILYDT